MTAVAKKRVLITGATGLVAGQILPAFRDRYDLVLLDVKDADRDGNRVDGVEIVDLIDPDRTGYAHYFEGVEAVVHLARRPFLEMGADQYSYEKVHVGMAYNVFRASFDGAVNRVVAASSVRASEWISNTLVAGREVEIVDPYEMPLASNFYGWAKASTEHMGFLFACGSMGRQMDVVMVRIGAPGDVTLERNSDRARYERSLGYYVSPRDITQLFTRAIDTPDIANEQGVPWQIVYGTSDNTRAYYSLANARQVLGYRPEDDSEVKFADGVRGVITNGPPAGGGRIGTG